MLDDLQLILTNIYFLWIYSNIYFSPMWQTNKSQNPGPSSSTSNGKEVEEPDDDDIDVDDDLDIDELNELEASLSRTSIQIREPGEGTSSWAVLQWKIVAKLLSIFALPSDLVAFANKEPWSTDASGIDLLALFTSYLEGATINKWRPVLWSHMTIDVCCVPYFFYLVPFVGNMLLLVNNRTKQFVSFPQTQQNFEVNTTMNLNDICVSDMHYVEITWSHTDIHYLLCHAAQYWHIFPCLDVAIVSIFKNSL